MKKSLLFLFPFLITNCSFAEEQSASRDYVEEGRNFEALTSSLNYFSGIYVLGEGRAGYSFGKVLTNNLNDLTQSELLEMDKFTRINYHGGVGLGYRNLNDKDVLIGADITATIAKGDDVKRKGTYTSQNITYDYTFNEKGTIDLKGYLGFKVMKNIVVGGNGGLTFRKYKYTSNTSHPSFTDGGTEGKSFNETAHFVNVGLFGEYGLTEKIGVRAGVNFSTTMSKGNIGYVCKNPKTMFSEKTIDLKLSLIFKI